MLVLWPKIVAQARRSPSLAQFQVRKKRRKQDHLANKETDDSLPDGWGLLLMDRHFRRQGVDPATLSPLDRLAYFGTHTMGALTYHPPTPGSVDRDDRLIDLYELGRNAEDVLEGDAVEVLCVKG